jgi:hypothetical protein
MAGNALDTLKNSVVVRIVAGVAVVAAAGWFVVTKMKPADHAEVAAQVAHPAPKPMSTPPPATAVASAKPAAGAASGPITVTASPVAANPNAPVSHPVSTAHPVADGNAAPVVNAVTTNATTTNVAHFDEHQTYQYNALGRRDPFQSLVEGAFVGVDVGGDAPPDPGGIKVVGIVWGATDQFALVEDVRGNSFVLRKGDKVQNGFVEGLKRDGLIVNITAEGQSQSVVIPLTRKGDQNAR